MISQTMLVAMSVLLLSMTTLDGLTVKTTDSTSSEFLFDISDNTRSAVRMGPESTIYSAVRSQIMHQVNQVETEYSYRKANVSSVYSYIEGVTYFQKMGHIFPYETLNGDQMVAYERTVTATEQQKFNLDEYTDVPNIVMVMVDDIGWNDLNLGPLHSTMIRGNAFPAMDALIKSGGITLDNYVSAAYCTPARGQFLTGKYSSFISMDSADNQMPMSEVTLAQELKTAGYHTMHIGKWGVGWDTYERLPMSRGFDTSFGYLGNQAEKYTKAIDPYDAAQLVNANYSGSVVDLWDDLEFVGDDHQYFGQGSIGSYLPFIFEKKGEEMLEAAASKRNSTGQPFFMYYASDLAHNPYVAPNYYIDRCSNLITENTNDDDTGYEPSEKLARCAMMLVLDETIGNLTCKLESLGMAENTLFAFASDNGGDVPGDNYPYLGGKFYEVEGGIKTPAAIFGSLIPEEKRGTSYSNLFHVTDWLPTLMQVATKGEWTESAKGSENVIDGVSHWDHLMGKSSSGMRPRDSALTYVDDEGRISIIQYQGEKLFHFMRGLETEATLEPDQLYTVGGESYTTCEVSDLSFAGMLPAVATRFFLRTKVAIADGTAAAMDMSIGVSTTTRLAMLAMLASLVALTLGSLLYKLHAARKKDPAVYKPVNTRYGAFAEDAGDDDSLLGM